MPVFSLEEARALQVKNISQQTFKYWPESAVYGYFIGGNIPPTLVSSTVNRLEFSTEVSSLPGKNLSPAPLGGLWGMGAISNPNGSYGYLGGGGFPGVFSTVYRLDFLSETISLPGQNLPAGRYFAAGSASNSYGYFVGGYTPPPTLNTIVRLDFSSETISLPGKALPAERAETASVYDKLGIYGYFGGGYGPPVIVKLCTIARLEFSTETTSLPGKNLNTARGPIAGTSSISYGYIVGGDNFPAHINTVSRLDFSTENVTNLANNLPSGLRSTYSGTSSNYFGYFSGGEAPLVSPGATCSIFRVDFSTEISSSLPVGLSQSRRHISTLSGGQSIYRGSKTYGYFVGGITPPTTYRCLISRLDFSNETMSDPAKNLSYSAYGMAAISNNYYGYFGGGTTAGGQINTISRLDFSNETTSLPGKNLPVVTTPAVSASQIREMGSVSSSFYGYFGGGIPTASPPILCNIIRFDFSTEDVILTQRFLPSQRRLLSSVSNTSYGYFCGGLDNNSIGVCTISRLDFTNETVSDPNKNLPGRRTDSAATSSNLYGYIAGGYDSLGYSSIARLDFSTEVVDAPATRNLPASLAPLYSLAATSSQFYGYFAGGTVPTGVSISNVTKLDFSNETVTLQPAPQSLPTARSNLTAVSNSN